MCIRCLIFSPLGEGEKGKKVPLSPLSFPHPPPYLGKGESREILNTPLPPIPTIPYSACVVHSFPARWPQLPDFNTGLRGRRLGELSTQDIY